ncbi:MAG: VOC family protein [Lachnospiraceae bacterium]|jgi:methylmalonyl-CoA/ethylmalonyl-CoA epimerase|nr:VOC family protein [Lachnospiraceae bacterium]MCI8994482.1 VOC family protein [Lachnospiraceae bacterium]MCI9133891.1 VOC family protein [Lachnospiraceae bacterium]
MIFHHIGIASADMGEALAYVRALFPVREVSETVYDEKQDASLCMVTLEDGSRMELITGPVVAGRVKKRQFLYHTCYETADLEESIRHFEEQGALVVSEPKEAVLFSMRRVAFLMTELGLLELLEQE